MTTVSDPDRQMSLANGGGAATTRPLTWRSPKDIDEYRLTGYHDNASRWTRFNGTTQRRAHRRSRYSSDDDHTAAGPTFPVTFKTPDSFLVTKVQLRSTFSIHFKVGSMRLKTGSGGNE